MALYNYAVNREYQNLPNNRGVSLTDSEIIHLYHNKPPEVEETIQSTNIWNPVERKIYGYLDCSNNPPFPEAYAGQMYIIQIGGTVGGYKVLQGDSIECISQYSAEGFGEIVKSRWIINKGSSLSNNCNYPNKDDIQDITQDFTGPFIDFGMFDSNTIIRRVLISIKKKYSKNSKFIFSISDTSIEINIDNYVEGDIIEDLRGFYIRKESKLQVTVPDYQYGSAVIVVEYYPVKEENALKTLRIDMSRSISSDFYIPKNSILSTVSIVPFEQYNPEAIMNFYLNNEILFSIPLNEIYVKYIFSEVFENTPIRIEIENYLKGRSTILVEYNISLK